MFCRGPRFIAWQAAKAVRTEDVLAGIEDIREAFQLSTATGAQLDILGGILQRERFGLDDATYRKVLQIQVELILPATATGPSIKRIVVIFTGESPSAFYEGDLHFGIDATLDGLDADDGQLLGQLIREATSAGYGTSITIGDTDALICDDADAPIADAGYLDDADSAVTGAGTLAWDLEP